jgi:myo-inositol 2-dehydrogenase / D-chiro-inositol 1-dehydrogenase
MNVPNGMSRRNFLLTTAAAGIAAQGFSILPAKGQEAKRKIKVGLIGCGGRGKGALHNIVEASALAGAEIEVLALADAFEDRAKGAGQEFGVPVERCFAGYDAYRKLLEQPVEVVLMATCPNFRPVHFEAAVKAGKHCFIEKPVAVDPPGIRRVIAAGEEAAKKNLSVVAGTQRRHSSGYLRNASAIRQGTVGRITGGTVLWCGGKLWFRQRAAGESDASYLTHNWTSFSSMSGDHIVEQHVHNLDVANWFIGRTPAWVMGCGGRARRQTGDQFDFFSLEYDYGENCRIHSMCRQVDGCYSSVGEMFTGTEGVVYGGGKIETYQPKKLEFQEFNTHPDGQVEEHIALLRSIIDGKPVNEAKTVAEATATAIMGRIAAYTGQLVRWSDLMTDDKSPFFNLCVSPTADDFEKGAVTAPKDDVVPVPGAA